MIRTKQKIFPLLLRLVSIIFGLIFWTLVSVYTRERLEEFSEPLLVGILAFISLGFLQIGASIFSIKTYSIDENKIVVNILWGLITRKIELREIKKMKFEQTKISFGKEVQQIILILKNGSSVFIEESEQKGFDEFRKEVDKFVELDNGIKPNYWTKYWKVTLIVIAFWMVVMLFLLIFEQR